MDGSQTNGDDCRRFIRIKPNAEDLKIEKFRGVNDVRIVKNTFQLLYILDFLKKAVQANCHQAPVHFLHVYLVVTPLTRYFAMNKGTSHDANFVQRSIANTQKSDYEVYIKRSVHNLRK